jgi:hypothetical protein
MVDIGETVVVGAFCNMRSSLAKLFRSLAEADMEHSYAISIVPEVHVELNTTCDSIVVVKPFEGLRHTLPLTASVSARDMELFIEKHAVPLLFEYSDSTIEQLLSSEVEVCLVWLSMCY